MFVSSRFQKKEVGSLDRVIQTSLKVKCLQKECDWTGCIKDYDVRIDKNLYFFSLLK